MDKVKKWTLKDVKKGLKEETLILVDPPPRFKSPYWKPFQMVYIKKNPKDHNRDYIFWKFAMSAWVSVVWTLKRTVLKFWTLKAVGWGKGCLLHWTHGCSTFKFVALFLLLLELSNFSGAYSDSSLLDRELKVNSVVLKSFLSSINQIRTKCEYELKVKFLGLFGD